MAIVLSDFNKIWASTSPLTPYSFSESNYKEGWNFIGSTPPARQMWDSYMKFSDEKQQYIVNNFLPLTGGTMTGEITREKTFSTTYEGSYVTKLTNVTSGTAPSSARPEYPFVITDNNGDRILFLGIWNNSNNSYTSRWGINWGENGEYLSLTIGAFYASSDNTCDLGRASNRWKEVFAGTGTINTSDERLKDNISAIPNEVLDAWGEVGFTQFQFKDSIAKKGESARIHCGLIAQRIKSVFEAHNLDAFRYGLLCYDEWDAEEEERDEDGNVIAEAKPAGNRYSLRYEEALCMEATYQRRRADRLEARIEALENALK